jgi:ABC-type multidrug transport system fused ATPase/permease subunit
MTPNAGDVSTALGSVRPAVRFVAGSRRRSLVKLASFAFVGGISEALFLITVTRAAFAITGDADRVGIVAGWFLSVDQTLLLALLLVVIRIGMASYASWLSADLSTQVVAQVRERLARAFLDASWELQQDLRAGSLQELLTTFAGQASAMITSLNQGIVAAANLVALVALAVAVDPLGAVILVVSVGCLGLLLRPLRRVVRNRADAVVRSGLDFATAANEISQLGLELHVFHVQDAAKSHVGALIEQVRERTKRLQFAGGLTTPAYTGLAYSALLAALAVAWLSNASSLTSLGAAMLVMLRSLSYGQALQGSYVTASASAPAIDQLRGQIESMEAGRRHDAGHPVGEMGAIAADHVWFAYTPGEDVLRDVSFTINPGEIVGIVGPSGSGKSTLVQLLLGLRDPTRGTVSSDGRDLCDFDRAELARKVTFVPQAAHLIAGTIADNIRFFRSGVAQERIEEAARLAHIHDDVVGFPGGYARQVGEHGGHLSGGQQQRLCIARALVEDPDVLIMDEPTSALDVRSEHLMRTTLVKLRGRVTVIVIAHRLSTLDMCDRIMVIQEGRLMGFDTPAALEQSNAFYREALSLSGMR